MRITYLAQYFITPQASGSTRAYEFARRLVDRGHQVCVITSNAMLPSPYRDLSKTTPMMIEGIPTIVIPVTYSNRMSFRRRIGAFLKFAVLASIQAAKTPADIVFATSTPLTIAIPGLVGKWWRRVPFVLEVRDLWPELPIAMGALQNPVARWLASALEWLAYQQAAHVIALSPGMKAGILRRGIDKAQVTVIPNASDVQRFDIPTPVPDPIRERLKLAPEQPLVVYAGTFGRINGVSYIVEIAAAALANAPDMHFLLIGDGAEFEHIQQLAHARGVLDVNLSIWKSIPKVEVPLVLASASMALSIFIPLPAMWNNSANKFFDSLAAGKPIAINYQGWQAELIERTGAGIVLPAAEPTRAAELLSAFLHDTSRLKRASAAARQLAYEDFERDRLFDLFEQVLIHAAAAADKTV